MSTAHDFKIPIVTEQDLRDYVRLAFGVVIPDVQVCPNHSTPWRAFSDAYFARYPVVIWKASRGFGGKSFLLSLLSVCEATTLKADVNVLGGSGAQSENVLEHMTRLWNHENAPRYLLSGNVQREMRLAWGNKVKALMASQTSVRGPHPQRLRLDEVDECDIRIVDAALGQPMGSNGIASQTVLSSTHQNPDGTMTELLRRAAEKDWPVYEWCVDGDSDILVPGETKKMKNIRPGDEIYAHKNGRVIRTTVTKQWSNGTKRTIGIETDRGTIICTPEHRILSGNGEWKHAASFAKGDKVFCVRQRTCFAWEICEKLWRHMLELHKKTDKQKTKWIGLPCLWREKTIDIKNLYKMLQIKYGNKKYANRRGYGFSPSTNSEFRKCSYENKPGRTGGRGIAWFIENRLFKRAKYRTSCGGLFDTGKEISHRSKWKILAHEARSNRERQEEGIGAERNGVCASSAMVRRIPFMDVAIIKKIRDCGYREVFDITVADGESFIANGIIAHNCWRETSAEPTGWLTQADIDRKRSEVSAIMWSVEYDLQEPSPESRAIYPDAVTKMFDAELGVYDGNVKQYIEIEPPWCNCPNCGFGKPLEQDNKCPNCNIPMISARYGTGADWAKKQDWTIIITLRIDLNPMKVVTFERLGRLPWPDMVARLDYVNNRYSARSCNDGTGLGDVVNGYLRTTSDGVMMIGRDRQDLLSNCISAIERGEFTSPFIRFFESQLKYASVDDVYGSGHLPDSLSALSLAYRAAGVGGWWMS